MYLLHVCVSEVIWCAFMYSEAWFESGVLAFIYVLIELDNTWSIGISAMLFGQMSGF